jgi:hypothetical protein
MASEEWTPVSVDMVPPRFPRKPKLANESGYTLAKREPETSIAFLCIIDGSESVMRTNLGAPDQRSLIRMKMMMVVSSSEKAVLLQVAHRQHRRRRYAGCTPRSTAILLGASHSAGTDRLR